MRRVFPAPAGPRGPAMRALALALAVAVSGTAARADTPPAPGATVAPGDAPPPAASPRPSNDVVKKELSDTIDAQLAAFRANDYPKAYTFAATEIKGLFGAAEFEKMVRASYPVIAHSTGADYGIAFDTGEEAVINVRISNAEVKGTEYQYLLKKEDGHWKISGVAEMKAPGLSV